MIILHNDNPRKKIYDILPIHFKIFIKTFIEPIFGRCHYNIIIPTTKNHAIWILGAQPWVFTIKKLCTKFNKKYIHIVSMLTDTEKLINQNNNLFINKNNLYSNIKWFDHSIINEITSVNSSITEIIKFQQYLQEKFIFSKKNTIFYCHCMAGRSRSFIETMCFIYLYPNKNKLFDWENWPKNIIDKINIDLQKKLKNNPSFEDIAKFISLQRFQVRDFSIMEGDQASIFGLLTLNNITKNNCYIILNEELTYLIREAQHIGLILKTSLNISFRNHLDLKIQKKNFIKAFNAFATRKIDLMMIMIIPLSTIVNINTYKLNFFDSFMKLNIEEKIRFILLISILKSNRCRIDPLLKKYHLYFNILSKDFKKISVADQIEYIKIFKKSEFNNKTIINRITKGNKLDRYNAGLKLSELLKIRDVYRKNIAMIIYSVNKINLYEQIVFLKNLCINKYNIIYKKKYNFFQNEIKINCLNSISPLIFKQSSIITMKKLIITFAIFLLFYVYR